MAAELWMGLGLITLFVMGSSQVARRLKRRSRQRLLLAESFERQQRTDFSSVPFSSSEGPHGWAA